MSEDSSAGKKSLDEELNALKEEMKEMRKILEAKKDINEPPKKPHSFKINIDQDLGENYDFDFSEVNNTLNDYLGTVMSGLSNNIRRSMQELGRNFHTIEFQTAREAQREARRVQRDLKNSFKSSKTIHLKKLSNEELDLFFEKAPGLMISLSDTKRLIILEELQKGPKYPGELSDASKASGGTFKHHMDTLVKSKFVYQEKTRGRYLITQLGVEGIKLAEMLFRRFLYEDAVEKGRINNDNEFNKAHEVKLEDDQDYKIEDVEGDNKNEDDKN